MTSVRVDDFDYDLPPDRIAQYPPARRDQSRLLELRRHSGAMRHRMFPEIVELLQPGDVLVLNDTRVLPARLLGRLPSGGQAELLLLEPVAEDCWRVLARPARRLGVGKTVSFGDGELEATIIEREAEGLRVVRFAYQGDWWAVLERVGQPPLPPYIRRPPEALDRERYQTVYAHTPGAVAAPTAGLHFTPELLEAVAARGVHICRITLHVGLGTFRPVQTERVEDHVMHAEQYQVSAEAARAINERRGRVVAVGTTVVRTLETVACAPGQVQPGAGRSELFIRPGYQFRVVEALLTNFHLPRSTLLMLVAAFAGREQVLAAYREALQRGYRFYSYGDCMFIH